MMNIQTTKKERKNECYSQYEYHRYKRNANNTWNNDWFDGICKAALKRENRREKNAFRQHAWNFGIQLELNRQ